MVRYTDYFKPQFLYISGDPIPRHSSQIVGTFYKIDILFLLIGFIALLIGLIRDRNKIHLFLLIWCLLAPVPAAFSSEFTHAARSMFITSSWHMIIALGICTLVEVLRYRPLKIVAIMLLIFGYLTNLKTYVSYYYGEYKIRYGTEWQYGMREIVGVIKENPQFYKVYMTDAFSQPYIFFLYYLKTPLPEFLRTVKYNEGHYRPSNLVVSFDRYKFGEWNQIESYPDPNILYVINPSKFDGLYYKNQFSVVRKIVYPNNTDAFYIINGYIE